MLSMLFRSGVLCVVGALVATVGVLVAPTSSAVPATSVAAASVTFTNYTTDDSLGNNTVRGVCMPWMTRSMPRQTVG